ncbi:MAG: bifunctional 5,10-methylenetetrahydrofolate dehydrogenase/5,10-methenyltetrahydrofolate cyclohydrolase [Thermoplasmatales archaeon]|nr:MAG: bifunctional 5,10-methylenetetrahydrofolate dehydrogenase/5,10-methenyltetrahydrofolate cyclohydrolase [Thermoplasmatales archaeon]
MTAKIVDGRKIAKEIRADIAKKFKELKSKYKVNPNITTIKIGNDPSSEIYLKLRDEACKEVGVKSNHLEFSNNVSEKEVLKAIKNLNENESVHGILIQFPIPEHISQDKLINALNPKKDVEGLTPYNLGKILIGDEDIVPCTPLSVITILENEKTNLKGKDIVIINHSTLVGKPLAALFLNRNATVSICHIFTKDIHKYISKADILVTAIGNAKMINSEYVKEGAFVIDVGIIKTKDGICGDVDFESVKEKAGKITPVPGGVGPVTVACSLINMLKVFEKNLL